jgi:phospholipase/carboxylesterase
LSRELLPAVEVEPERAARAAVIWLHGLGADGHDFEPVVPHLGLPEAAGVRFVFPHAPAIPVTINGGFVMPAWYDIVELESRRGHDMAGIARSAESVRALIRRENERGVPSERIVLAGFSQGGAIAAYVALRHPEPLAGLMLLSCYLVGGDTLAAEHSAANAELPIFQAHGTHDPMVRYERGVELRDRLVALGHEVEWHEYPMQHQVCLEELAAIGAYLRARLA